MRVAALLETSGLSQVKSSQCFNTHWRKETYSYTRGTKET